MVIDYANTTKRGLRRAIGGGKYLSGVTNVYFNLFKRKLYIMIIDHIRIYCSYDDLHITNMIDLFINSKSDLFRLIYQSVRQRVGQIRTC